ncbi:unnamed protein product [Arabidopsis thaliana]|nr:unnamed protein product [Arabidopsis thaliana]
MFFEKISYEELYNATSGFSSSNLIGSGNFSDVFKGLLGLENKLVVVNVLNLLKYGATKSFIAECESFKGIRHRNLVKLITVCSSLDSQGNDFRTLVYEFMPKGSLDIYVATARRFGKCKQSLSNVVDEWLRLVLEVGIKCSEEYARDRMGMAEAVRELVSIKSKFFSSSR